MKLKQFIWICLIGALFVNAQTKTGFAAHLMGERDYFRAISEYKRLAFYSRDSVEIRNSYLQISKAYYKSGRYNASLQYAAYLLNMGKLPADIQIRAENYMGLNYHAMGLYNRALHVFSENAKLDPGPFSRLYEGLVLTEAGKWKQAANTYKMLNKYPAEPFAGLGGELSTKVLQGVNIPQKSPFVAGAFSALFPGGGQIYTDHPIDAIQAFLFVGAFAFSSYMAYKYDSENNRSYLTTGVALSITALFHAGNIIGAYRTAEYYNQKKRNDFIGGIREKVLKLDY